MMKNVTKKLGSLLLAFAIAFTALVVDVTPVQAATIYSNTTVYPISSKIGYAGQEVKIPFTVTENDVVLMEIQTYEAVSVTLTLYTSTGSVYSVDKNVSAGDFSEKEGIYYYDDFWYSLPAGDYYYGVTFTTDTKFALEIMQVNAVSISQTTATITKGFTKKLEVSGAKVKSWSSSKKSVATVNSKGKVTAKKAGKATITATLYDGTKLKCKVTVKNNKYSATKITTSNVTYGECAVKAYSASYDSKGNLVLKVRVANNSYYKVTKLHDFTFTVKNANKKTVGTYKFSSKSVNIPAYSTKDFTFTIKKSSLKIKKKQDLRNSTISFGDKAWYNYTY